MASTAPQILYKYTDVVGAEKTLTEKTLKFSHYSQFNDPFDADFRDMYGFDVEEVKQNTQELRKQALEENNPQRFADVSKLPLNEAVMICQLYQHFPPDKKKEYHARVAVEQNTRPESIISRLILEQSIETARQLFETIAVFCVTSDYHNLLMWAHYADKHRGVVIGLKPDLEKDSVLTQIRPVNYTEQRPNLLDPAHQQRHQSSEEWALEAFYRVLHTKSPEWAYEQEYRLTMPYAIKPGEKEWLLNLHPKEVVELYLGCRLDSPSKERLIALAKKLNPEVRIFQAYTEKRSYNLGFLPI